MALFRSRTATAAPESPAARAHRLALVANATIEVVPMKNLEAARPHLPAGATLSVTCSPVKGIETTQRLTEEFLGDGFDPIPHIAARMVRDRTHVAELAAWCRELGLGRLFLVGGDANPPGDYPDAVAFLRDFLDTDHGLSAIGVTAYPDHHAFIPDEALHEALHAKQRLLADAGLDAWCSTQMCFNAAAIETWLRRERALGLELPVHLGVSGVVDKAKLLTTGMRIGLGESLAYLKKNRTAIASMMTTTTYDPNDLLIPLSASNLDLGVDGLHLYTFNQVEATESWRQAVLATV